MENTTKALAELRTHWKDEGCPHIAKIAKKANVPSATANRYLSGVTKGGTPETIRALAIAMDRKDIADSIPYTSLGGNEHAEDYIAELHKQWDEAAQQRSAEEAARHKQEMDDLMRDHRAERDSWHKQRDAYCEEIERLSKSFDSLTRIHHREKWIAFALCIGSLLLLALAK
jgi:transcriptional regulator with XRE-family HTH domain